MADERKPQDEPQAEVKEAEELSEEELDKVAGGFPGLSNMINNMIGDSLASAGDNG